MEELFEKSEAELEEILRKFWKCDSLELIGRYTLSKSPDEVGFGYFSSPIMNDRDVLYPKPVVKRKVTIRVIHSDKYTFDDKYKIRAKIAPLQLRKDLNNPFLLVIDNSFPIEIVENMLTHKDRLWNFLNRYNLSENRFTGRCIQNKSNHLIMIDIVSKKKSIKLTRENGQNFTILIDKLRDSFKIDSYYEFSISVNYNESQAKEFVIIDTKTAQFFEIDNPIDKKHSKLINSFLSKNKISENRFIGKCIITDKKIVFMSEIISKYEGNFLLDDNGNRQTIFLGKDENNFLNNKFYEFSIFQNVYSDSIRNVLGIDTKINPPIELDYNPYQEIVRLRYERLDNPEANKMIANLMREIGKGLYSSKQRMIFELLQNADDTPAGDEVNFYIDTHEDYFLIMHNGIPFNRDDVEAITSAAESTKRHDRKKTGYKGIGFKSVFTDSEEVMIKSGGFLFSFLRNYSGFESFDTFYFNKQRYIDYPKLLEEDKLKYKKQRKTFHGNTDIPWQLIPIWQDNVPESLQETRFVQFENNNNVGIAIKFGDEKIKGYLDAVATFAQKPHFMLFLRNVTLFKSFKNQVEIKKSGINPITIEKKNWDRSDFVIKYFKKEIDNIEVNDESLAQEGINIYKREKINEYGEINHFFSYDPEGTKEIESIPPKLAAFDKTVITFAAPVIGDEIQFEPDYRKDRITSSFFTYLPMKEDRIRLPFLVNADFVPDSSREKLQGDNQWNEYIFAKIAKYHVLWLKELAEQCVESQHVHPEYLSLLLKDELPEDDTINQLIRKYNNVYLEAIEQVNFILSDDWRVLKTDEIILDEIGITKILGEDCFYDTAKTNLRLPNSNINSKYLFYNYLNIAKYTLGNFFITLKYDTDIIEKFRVTVSLLDIEKYDDFLNWVNDIAKEDKIDKTWLFYLPFINVRGNIFSFNEIIESDNTLLNEGRLDSIKEILIKLGYKVGDVKLDNYNNIWDKLDVYKISDSDIYEILKENVNLGLLEPEDKSNLLLFIKELNRIGEDKWAHSIKLFRSEDPNSDLKPLSQLISNDIIDLPDWLIPLRINKEEEDALDRLFKKYLIRQDELLQNLFSNHGLFNQIITNINETNLESFYRYINNLIDNNSEDVIGITEIPWIYTSSDIPFQTSYNVYFCDSLLKLKQIDYEIVKQVIEKISELRLPVFESFNLINSLNLGPKRIEIKDAIEKIITLELDEINHFLDWLEINREEDIFDYITITGKDNLYEISPEKNNYQYYTENDKLIEYIKSDDGLNKRFYLLDKSIYSKNRHKLGLLESENLISKIIDKECVNNEFSLFIPLSTSKNIITSYLALIDEINIDTNDVNDAKSPVNKILNLAIEAIYDNDDSINNFRSKILIDNNSLTERAFTNDIYFHQSNIELTVKMSDVLTEYKEKTYSFTSVLKSFEEIDKGKLKKIFEPQRKTPKSIYNELIDSISGSNENYFDAHQLFFYAYYRDSFPNEIRTEYNGSFVSNYTDKFDVYTKEAKLFLSLCFNNKFTNYRKYEELPDFNPEITILDHDFALDNEKTIQWVIEWINEEVEIKEDRIKFLKELGLNDMTSPVVRLRKAMLNGDNDMDEARGRLHNKTLIQNTLLWIQLNSSKIKIQLLDEVLRPLYIKAKTSGLKIQEIPIPVISDINTRSLKLIDYTTKFDYHFYKNTWAEHKEAIFRYTTQNNIKVLSEVLIQNYKADLVTYEYDVVEELDQQLINDKIEDFSERFYTTWSRRKELIIKKYKGSKLPYRLSYNSHPIKKFEKDLYIKNNGYVIVCENIIKSIPNSIKDLMPLELYNDFNSHIKEFEENINKINYTDEEISALKKFLNDEEIPVEFRKNLNLASLVSALVKLDKLGFNIESANNNLEYSHEFAQLSPVYKGYKEYTVMCRSARQGLLYMTAKAWNRLDDDSILLFIDTGHNDYKLFYNKQDVLNANVKETDYQILRIETAANVSDVDAILNGTYNQLDKLWIIFRVKENKNYDALYYKKLSADNSSKNSSSVKNDYSDINEY